MLSASNIFSILSPMVARADCFGLPLRETFPAPPADKQTVRVKVCTGRDQFPCLDVSRVRSRENLVGRR